MFSSNRIFCLNLVLLSLRRRRHRRHQTKQEPLHLNKISLMKLIERIWNH